KQVFTDVRAVAVGGIDQVDIEPGKAFQRRACRGRIERIAPDAWTGHAHRAKAEAIDRQIATDPELAGCGRGDWIGHVVLLLSWMLLVGLKAPGETRRSEHVVPKSGRVERSSRSERSLPRTRSGVET